MLWFLPPLSPSTGTRSKPPLGCGLQALVCSTPAGWRQWPGDDAFSPARLWAQSHLFPRGVFISGAPDVLVTGTFQGIWATGFSKCPSVHFSLIPEATQMASSVWKCNSAIQTHTPFPFYCGGTLRLLFIAAHNLQRGH